MCRQSKSRAFPEAPLRVGFISRAKSRGGLSQKPRKHAALMSHGDSEPREVDLDGKMPEIQDMHQASLPTMFQVQYHDYTPCLIGRVSASLA